MVSGRARNLVFLAPIVLGAFLFGLQVVNADRVVRGITVGDIALGGKTQKEAREILHQQAEAIRSTPIVISGGSWNTSRMPAELGVTIHEKATLEAFWRFGRRGNLFGDIYSQVVAIFSPRSITATVEINEGVFQEGLSEALKDYEHPAQNATLTWNEKTKSFNEVSEDPGKIVDRTTVRSAIFSSLENLESPQEIRALLVTDLPVATRQDLPAVKTLAEKILARAPYTLKAGDITQELSQNDIAPLLAFTPTKEAAPGDRIIVTLDNAAAGEFPLNTLVPKVNRDPVDAKFRVANGRVTTFALARNGQTLDLPASLGILSVTILSDNATTATLPVAITEPTIGNDAAEELGIRELVAVGETNFVGSPANRIHNIKVGASRYDGVLVKPGEEFSFNALLGPVDAAAGYKPELVIKQDKTIPEYGGGLCQVSTTAFQTAVKAGMKITERRNHAFAVRYYGTPGFDATIYPPHPDMRFLNNTPAHILIQTSVVGTKLRFEFYGTNDGRTVDVVGPRVYDQKADGSAKATLTVHVTDAEGTKTTQTFNSTYRSPNLYPVERRNPLE